MKLDSKKVSQKPKRSVATKPKSYNRVRESSYTALMKYEGKLREGPTVNSNLLYIIPENSQVKVIDDSNKVFYKIEIDGYTGYISKNYLNMK